MEKQNINKDDKNDDQPNAGDREDTKHMDQNKIYIQRFFFKLGKSQNARHNYKKRVRKIYCYDFEISLAFILLFKVNKDYLFVANHYKTYISFKKTQTHN